MINSAALPRVKPLFEFKLPKQGGKASCWQEFTLRNMPELLQPVEACKFIDERGVVVGLQPDFIDNIAMQVAQSRPQTLQKIFRVG